MLCQNVPGAVRVEKASEQEDKKGTDWWIILSNGDRLAVDCKVRESDWAQRGHDDLALETWSVIEANVPGWTRSEKKRTDYILWLWKETGRWCLIPFPMLCKVFSLRWEEWSKTYKVAKQRTPGLRPYHSECVFVPRRIVWAEIYRQFSGTPQSSALPA